MYPFLFYEWIRFFFIQTSCVRPWEGPSGVHGNQSMTDVCLQLLSLAGKLFGFNYTFKPNWTVSGWILIIFISERFF